MLNEYITQYLKAVYSSSNSTTDGFRQLCSRPVHGSVCYISPLHQSVQIQPLHRILGTSRHSRVVPQVSLTIQEGFREIHY